MSKNLLNGRSNELLYLGFFSKNLFAKNKFEPQPGSANVYGHGMYTFYELREGDWQYGTWLYKLEVDLTNYICFDQEACRQIYGKI